MKFFPNFFVKKSEIVLDCFTDVAHVYDNAKINHAHKFFPEWFKNTPKIHGQAEGKIDPNMTSIKNCVGLKDFYIKGIAIPSWFTMRLTVNPIGVDPAWQWESSHSDMLTDNSHHQDAFKGFAKDTGHNLKVSSPWFFRTKEEIYFTWTQPTWGQRSWLDNRVSILPAVINFYYQHATEINLFLVQEEYKQEINIDPLEPLVILHPMTEKNVIIKTHLVDEKEKMRLMSMDKLLFQHGAFDSISFYNRKKAMKKKLQELNNSQCPFSSR